MEITEFNIGYLSGLIDGEGCLNIYKNSYGGFYSTLEVKIFEKKICNYLKKIIGSGSIRRYKHKGLNNRDMWVFVVTKRGLLRILPYLKLKIKGKQKNIILMFYDIKNKEVKLQLYNEMKRLNRRGKILEDVDFKEEQKEYNQKLKENK